MIFHRRQEDRVRSVLYELGRRYFRRGDAARRAELFHGPNAVLFDVPDPGANCFALGGGADQEEKSKGASEGYVPPGSGLYGRNSGLPPAA